MDSTLVSTMAGGPQVVTFALDELLRRGESIQEVIVVHLSPQADPLTGQAIIKLSAEFADDHYAGRPCRLRFFPIRRGQEKLDDIRDEADADAAWSSIHGLISTLKAQQRHLHVCIAGGRRILALVAMSAAMLHFDHHDCLWHMYTPAEFLERARNGAIMHARPEDGVRLIRVPVVPWGAYFPPLRALAQGTSAPALTAQVRWLDEVERSRCQAVLKRLTRRKQDVLRCLAQGLSPQETAEVLGITLKTVDSHKTIILDECRNAWGLPEDSWLDYHFLRDKFGLFFAGQSSLQDSTKGRQKHQRNL